MSTPVEHDDPINAKILEISEDLISGFQRQPFHLIAEKSGIEIDRKTLSDMAINEPVGFEQLVEKVKSSIN